MKSKPTNRFVARVSIPFPNGPDGNNILRWLNLQHCGNELLVPHRISKEHKESHYVVHCGRQFELVFEVTKSGDWIFVGRKA